MQPSTALSIEDRNLRVFDFRRQFREEVIPKFYSGILHLLFNGAVLTGICVVSLLQLDNVTYLDLLTIPGMIVLGSLTVWFIHKYVLHRPKISSFAYKAHTKYHHNFFTHEVTTFDSTRDFYTLIFPWWSPLFFLLTYVPAVYFGYGSIASNNSTWLAIFMGSFYFISYEVFHYCSHLPDTHFMLKFPPFKLMKRHHQVHHNPKLMSHYNFNVVCPLFDFLLGTAYDERKSN